MTAPSRQHVLHPRLEAHLDAGLDQLLAHALHREGQQVRADVRLALDEDAVRRAVLREGLDHLAHEGVVDARGELAVGVRAGAALAEVHVALGHQRAVAHQLGHVLAALHHVAAALER